MPVVAAELEVVVRRLCAMKAPKVLNGVRAMS